VLIVKRLFVNKMRFINEGLVGYVVAAPEDSVHQHATSLGRGHPRLPAVDIDSLHLHGFWEMAADFRFQQCPIEGVLVPGN